MRTIIALLLLCLAVSARAREWKSEIFHCSANVPDSNGWQTIEAPTAPGLVVLLAMQHPGKQAVFGINVIEKFRDANLADPAIQKELEAMLRQFGYQFVGHSNVSEGGLGWLQYPVVAGVGPQQVRGVIRFASAGGYVFGITMLRGGGQEASQDVELQQAAKSFRIIPATALAAAPGKSAPVSPGTDTSADTSPEGAEEPVGGDDSRLRMIWYAVGGVVVLLVFFSIIGGRSKKD
jgi:hypothetical protein